MNELVPAPTQGFQIYFLTIMTMISTLAFVLALSGCKPLEEQIEAKLGIQAEIKADLSLDTCAVKQLKSFRSDLRKMKPSQLATFSASLKNNTKSVVLTTSSQIRVTGEVVKLHYGNYLCFDTGCRWQTVATKELLNTSQPVGLPSTTIVERQGDVVTVTPVRLRDDRAFKSYITASVAAFDRIEDTGAALEAARANKTVTLFGYNDEIEYRCVRDASVQELRN